MQPSTVTVEVLGRLHFRVSSRRRRDVFHLVDLEPQDGRKYFCSCEAHTLNRHHLGQPCAHIEAVVNFIRDATSSMDPTAEPASR